MDVIGYVMAASGALCVILGVWGFSLVTAERRFSVSALSDVGGGAEEEGFVLDRLAGVLGAPLAGLALTALAPWRSSIRERIAAAGRPAGLSTVEAYARVTAGYVVIFGGLGLVFAALGQGAFGVVCFAGCLQNEYRLYGRKKARQDDIQRSIPDFLDVLAVTVSAGLSFRVALARTADSMPGPLADEFRLALRQMDLGTPRREAFEDLRRRNDSEGVNQFVTALLQAEELGAPLRTALVDISNDLRRSSAQWAKRKAQRTTPKITVITMTMSLPALMLVVLAALFYGSGVSPGGLFGG
ncbi:type II secretion system F family protein [Actinomadura rugatobispora]|uniref:Type II secretion system F family protein n=1 Tax=Actinomadura rugatobispora TaxID=1994 RepID=A0ABW0ZQX7_9ACTN